MSHFSVIVATKDEPTEEVLDRELQPFHEFECTATDDQFVQDVDVTEERVSSWKDGASSRLRDLEGGLHCPYDDRFFREPTAEEIKRIGPMAGSGCGDGVQWSSREWNDGRGYRTKIKFIPPGWTEVEVPLPELSTLEQWLEADGVRVVTSAADLDLKKDHKYGYAIKTADGVRIIRRTNPNHKWDYWRVGGRYAGKFQIKGRIAAPRKDLSWEWEREPDIERPTGVDQCRKDALDFDAMKAAAVASRRKFWDECLAKSELTADELSLAIATANELHRQWLELPEPRPRGGDYHKWLGESGCPNADKLSRLWDKPEIPAGMTAEDWINSAAALTGFAFLMDGKWAAEGDMGFLACVSNENANWLNDFAALIEAVPNDYWLTVVDCHC